MLSNLKKIACTAIDDRSSDLNNISQTLWDNPELSDQEFFAHDFLASFLEKEGFTVEKKTPLQTSFVAKYGKSGGVKIGVVCEYDALPGVGHACGHNLIAEAGIGAALGIKAVLMHDANLKADLIVYGAPAEEEGGGKARMIEHGVFDEADICMMIHPSPYEIPVPVRLSKAELRINFQGKASHAAAAPWDGVNALDAAVTCYNNVSMLRQQMKPTCRVHCTIVKGGERPNVIPEKSEMSFYVRGLTDEDTQGLVLKVKECANGAAVATGCTVTITDDSPFYCALKTNKILVNLYIENAKSFGVVFNDDHLASKLTASTDMGNVSQIKPSMQPLFKINSEGYNHTRKFAHASALPENQLPTIIRAKCMSMTVVDILCSSNLLDEIKKEFNG